MGDGGGAVDQDHAFIARALELAALAKGKTSPNPMVGAVVVSDGTVLGEGYHHKAGMPHAEILALRQAGLRARGATLYVSLEPCCHFGRTPPCTEAIIRAAIKRVVAATPDPNPLMAGNGLQAISRHQRVWVRGGRDHPLDGRSDNRLGAWRCPSKVAAGLQRNVQGRPPGP